MLSKKYKNIDISLIETRVPEDILLKAEEVMDNGGISGLIQKSEYQWEAVVIDHNLHYTNSVILKSGQLKEYSCNCTIFSQTGFCGHLLALIFHLRKSIQQKEKVKDSLKKRRSKVKQFNLSELLGLLTREEIETFVMAKARTDRNFKLLLQARFIEKLDQDQLAPFIESTFQVLTKANEKIPASKLKTFLDITDELFHHFKNLIAHEDLIEAYNLAFLLLKKSFYIKYHLNSDHARFYKHHNNLLSNYIEVYKLIEAPEYKEIIYNQLQELLGASYISASLTKEKDLWMLFYNSPERRNILIDIVNSYLERSQKTDYNSLYFIKMLELILLENDDERIKEISKKNMQESYRIIQYLSAYQSYPACQKVMHDFYCVKTLNHPLAKSIIESIEALPEYIEKLKIKTADYFIRYKDNIYLTFIKKISDDWQVSKTQLTETLQRKGQPSILIKFHLECNDFDEAIEILEKELSWDLLKTYDIAITSINEIACLELYYKTLEYYLTNHFGVHAIDYCRMVFNRIELIDQKPWLKILKQRLIKRFPERKSLFR